MKFNLKLSKKTPENDTQQFVEPIQEDIYKKDDMDVGINDTVDNDEYNSLLFEDENYFAKDINRAAKAKPKKNKKKKDVKHIGNSLQEINKYNDNKMSQKMYWGIIGASFAGAIVVSLLFKLGIICTIIMCAADLFCTPKILIATCRNKYEENKFNEATTYIEQMLYSFRKNSKILGSLYDALVIFPKGLMHDCLLKAIEHIQTGMSKGNIYEESLKIIEKEYGCRRINSLHRYLIKVENAGGSHDMGVSALLNDRRLWVERKDEFKKEKSSVIKEIVVSSIFSTCIILFVLYMLPDHGASMESTVARIVSTAYLLSNLFSITASFTKTVNYLNDVENENHEAMMIKKLNWYKTYDKDDERKRAFKPGLAFLIIGLASAVLGQKLIAIICLMSSLYAMFLQPMLKYKGVKKSLIAEFEQTYPDWLLELSLLLQTDNMHVALEKTIDQAPGILRQDLRKLSDDIIMYPTDIKPYTDFLNYLPLESIHSSMRLLYSIAEFGAEEEEKQISELIERNSILMSKAESAKNKNRLLVTYTLKFVPLGTSAVTLIVQMTVFILNFVLTTLSSTF